MWQCQWNLRYSHCFRRFLRRCLPRHRFVQVRGLNRMGEL